MALVGLADFKSVGGDLVAAGFDSPPPFLYDSIAGKEGSYA